MGQLWTTPQPPSSFSYDAVQGATFTLPHIKGHYYNNTLTLINNGVMTTHRHRLDHQQLHRLYQALVDGKDTTEALTIVFRGYN